MHSWEHVPFVPLKLTTSLVAIVRKPHTRGQHIPSGTPCQKVIFPFFVKKAIYWPVETCWNALIVLVQSLKCPAYVRNASAWSGLPRMLAQTMEVTVGVSEVGG